MTAPFRQIAAHNLHGRWLDAAIAVEVTQTWVESEPRDFTNGIALRHENGDKRWECVSEEGITRQIGIGPLRYSKNIADAFRILDDSRFRFMLDLSSSGKRWRIEHYVGRSRLVWFRPGGSRVDGPWVRETTEDGYESPPSRNTARAICVAALKAVRVGL